MGRWLCDVENIRNELIRGETGWSTFEESERRKSNDGMDVTSGCHEISCTRNMLLHLF